MKLGDIMKQAQQMQAGLAQAQEAIKTLEVTGEAGAGLVKVRMTGAMEVLGVDIDPSILTENKDVLEDLLAAAVNDAVRRAQAVAQEKMGGLTAGIDIPEGFNMPF